jgi:acyl carrier protein
MNDADMRSLVLETIGEIAPEADLDQLDPTGDLRDELDLDSMDLLNVTAGLEERLGISVPERDYPKMRTLDDTVAYLIGRQPVPPA